MRWRAHIIRGANKVNVIRKYDLQAHTRSSNPERYDNNVAHILLHTYTSIIQEWDTLFRVSGGKNNATTTKVIILNMDQNADGRV